MTASFDIFETDADGSVLWLGSAKTMEEATARVQGLAERSSHEYIILNQATGARLVINRDGAEHPARPDGLRLPAWKKMSLQALSESDRQVLPEMVAAAEAAIAQRLNELKDLPDEDPEKVALRNAIRALNIIKNEEGLPPAQKATSAG